jgi:hypothetical protein
MFRIEQLHVRPINKISGLFEARKGLVRLVTRHQIAAGRSKSLLHGFERA